MSDYNSSLPVRTENNGDVVSKIVDYTVNTQGLLVNPDGSINTNNTPTSPNVNIHDGAGNSLTSQVNGSQRALDVGINVGGIQIDPRQIRALTSADTVTVVQPSGASLHVNVDNFPADADAYAQGSTTSGQLGNLTMGAVTTASPSYTTGQTDPLSLTLAGALRVDGSATTQPVSGTVTANQGTSPWITKDQSDGPVAPGTVASFSQLAGGQFNTTPPTLTNGQQAALQLDSAGRLLVDANIVSTDDHNYGTVGANTLRTAAQIGNATGAADFNFGTVGAQTLRVAAEVGNATGLLDDNFGTVGAQTLRVASQIGNATGAADFNAGATGAQTLRVSANLAVGGANVTAANPVPVTIEDTPGTHINDFKDAAAIAAGASDNHDYTVTAGKTLHLQQVESSASGKAKMQVQVETGVATNVFTSYFVQFNSTATPNMSIHLDDDILVAAGVRVRLIMTNKDNQAQDLYSTISGFEI